MRQSWWWKEVPDGWLLQDCSVTNELVSFCSILFEICLTFDFSCVRHGGGRKCTRSGCQKVSRGKSGLCAFHGHQRMEELSVGSASESVCSLKSLQTVASIEGIEESKEPSYYDGNSVAGFPTTMFPPYHQYCLPAYTQPSVLFFPEQFMYATRS